jgi:ribosomal protein L16 Arg81 hydroxylase
MTELIDSFERLLDPITPETFFAEVHHKKALHIAGRPDKFASVMSWDILNEFLAMDVWDGNTLYLVLNRQRVPPAAYSNTMLNRNKRQVLQPDAGKVMDFISRGASLVLNNVETLHPGCLAVTETIGNHLGAKVWANIYCSWNQQQAFDSHYDRHDVFALHIVGEKRWQVYEGCMDNPIEHASFYNVPQAEYDRLKGRIGQEITMRPGDLLYLPRGRFHDALALSGSSVHVSFGCNETTGLDWLGHFLVRAIADSSFRAYLPNAEIPAGEQALRAHLDMLVDRLKTMALNQEGLAAAKTFQREFSVKRKPYDLPNR